MLFGLLCAFVLAGVLLAQRSRTAPGAFAPAWSGNATSADKVVAAVLLVVGVAPFFPLLPWLGGSSPTYFADAVAHAHVARDIAERGLPHGWVDTYLAGFPFWLHYPPLSTLVLAGTLKLGVSPASAVSFWGLSSILAGSVTLYVSATRAGARPAFASVGAAYLAWVSPYNPFVGGYEAYFQLGLFAQVMALPLCIALGAVVARGGDAWPAPVAALAMATHPQLAVAAVAALGLAAFASGRRDVAARFGRAVAGALAFGIAVYGPGIANHRIPFGWPPELGWRVVGFGTSRFGWWFIDGDLLDRGRELAPLTSLAGAALFALSLRARRPVARAGLVAAAVTVALSAVGPALSRLEPVGPALLSVFQPLRALALVPAVAAALVVIALEEATPVLQGGLAAFGRRQLVVLAPWSTLAAAAGTLAFAAPERASYASKLASELARRAQGQCEGAPPGYRRAEIASWVRSLRTGRLWFEDKDEDALERCLLLDGIPLESGVPIGTTGGGPGAHVGIASLAFHSLEPVRPGAERRAEALGVRHVLTVVGASGFAVKRRAGKVSLMSRGGATDLVGAGCIVERWRGSDRALRDRLIAEFKTDAGADRLLDPSRLVALDHAEGKLSTRASDDGGCDARNVLVMATSREPGAIEAVVETPAPVDVVFRVAAFPTWHVTLDGEPLGRTDLVAPGFVAVRVPSGRHRVAAVVSGVPGYAVFIALGAAGVVLASLGRTHLERALELARRLKSRAPRGT